MKMRSPIVAMLWEIWRVTRVEAAWRLALGVGVALVALILSAVFAPSEIAAWEHGRVVSPGSSCSCRTSWGGYLLRGSRRSTRLSALSPLHPSDSDGSHGRPPDGVSHGRDVRHIPGVCISTESGLRLPVFGAARRSVDRGHCLGPLHNRLVDPQHGRPDAGKVGYPLCRGGFVGARLDSFPNDVDYPLTDYAVIALIGLVCFGVTVASVARQRRGDAQTAITRTSGSGLRGWLIDLFPFPCPTSSATRAQVWLDLKSNGLPVLTIGVALAMVILLVSAVSNPIDAADECGPICLARSGTASTPGRCPSS